VVLAAPPAHCSGMERLAAHDQPLGRCHVTLIELRAGRYAAAVSLVGGALARLTYDDRPLVLDTTGAVDSGSVPMPAFSGAVLAPWPNRIRDGRYSFNGAVHQLPINEVERGCALHGLLVWTRWDVVDRTENSVRLESTVWPQPGYPFTIVVTVDYALRADGLHVDLDAVNRGRVAAPFGASIHPYLVPGVVDGDMDDWTLTLPMASVIDVEPERLLPRRTLEVDGTAFDFQAPRRLAGVMLDHAFGDAAERAATLTGPDGFGTVVSWDDRNRWLQVCTIDAAPVPWRRTGLAVEPMTCPPDAFNSGTDLWTLAPGERRGCGLAIAAT
jgi:aldose 1-epimerase